MTETSVYLRTLASFVPQMILREANADMGAPTQASLRRSEVAGLFVDVAGFTALTETLAQRGAAGAEDLTTLLNSYLGRLIDAIADAGGDIVKFAGDAVVALWPTDGEGGDDLARQTARAIACALDIRERLNDVEVADGFRMRVKLAVGAGECWAERLGGVFDRWELLIAGDALRQIGLVSDHARPGDLIVSKEALSLIAGRFEGEAVPDGARRVTALTDPAPVAMAAPPLTPEPHAATALKAFIPAAARTRLDAEHLGWLGELRRLSVVFMNLPGFNAKTPLDRAQEAMRAVQMAIYRFEGSINKMSVDDKGASLIAVFGLPPLAHVDDPERAVRAAVASRAALEKLGVSAAIGVTTGVAFCGVVGSERRREYTIMGDVVNLAARLMQAAGGGKTGSPIEGGVLCSDPTRAASGANLAFETLAPIRVKGKAERIVVHRPLPEAPAADPSAQAQRSVRIVGREAERKAIGAMLDDVCDGGRARRLVVLGDGGIGKSRLLQDAVAKASRRGMMALIGAGHPIETSAPYRAWRPVFERLLVGDAEGDDERKRAVILANLPDDPVAIGDAPLLEAVLPYGFDDNDFTRGLAGQARAERTRDLLCAVLADAARKATTLLVLKDAHWFDSASMALLRQASRLDGPIAFVVSSRRFSGAPPAGWTEIFDAPGLETINLGPLEPAALEELCRRRLGVRALPKSLNAFIEMRCEGNPLFAEELVFYLRDSGVIVVDGETARIASGREDPATWGLPTTMEGLVSARIDRLEPAVQMTMKVASVIGRVFGEEALVKVHPAERERAILTEHCEELARLEMTPPVKAGSLLASAVGGGSAWKFKSTLLKDVAYNLMLFSQRRDLHRRLATWLEADGDPERPAAAALLAFHWRHASEGRPLDPESAMKAAAYYGRAANHALKLHALREAMEFWSEGIALLRRLPESEDRSRRELGLLLELGPVQVAVRSFSAPEVEETFDRARELCERVGEHEQLFRAIRGLWQVRIGQGGYGAAGALADELLELAEKADDRILKMEARRAIGTTAFWIADFPTSKTNLEIAAALYDPERDGDLARIYGQDPLVATRGILAWSLAHLGQRDAARTEAAKVVARAEALEHPFTMVYAYGVEMWVGYFLDDRHAAAAAASRGADLSLERGFAYFAIAGRTIRGWARGETADMEAAVNEWRAAGGGIGLQVFLLVQADAQLAEGRWRDALVTLDDPALVDGKRREPWLDPLASRLRGEALAASGDAAAARAAFADGLAIAEGQSAAMHAGRLRALLEA